MKKDKTIAVDLDATLAEYVHFEGPTSIGEPLPGAVAFVTELAKLGRIVIYTARLTDPRCNTPFGPSKETNDAIEAWLTKHNIPFDVVYPKLNASVFIDDKGVQCRPQENMAAYDQTLAEVKRVLSLSRQKDRLEKK